MDSEASKKYVPAPIRIEGVELGGDLEDLLEALAQNAHDIWALRRLKEGWTWGPGRSDEARTHPCLVSYRDLPDSEKEYDRILVRNTLRAIVALGYRVSRSSNAGE